MLNAFAIKRICPSNSNGSERLKQNIWFHWKCLFMHIRNDLIMAQTGKQKNYKGIYFDLREDPRLKQFCFPKLGLFQYIFNLHSFSFSRCAGDFREENWLLVVYGSGKTFRPSQLMNFRSDLSFKNTMHREMHTFVPNFLFPRTAFTQLNLQTNAWKIGKMNWWSSCQDASSNLVNKILTLLFTNCHVCKIKFWKKFFCHQVLNKHIWLLCLPVKMAS